MSVKWMVSGFSVSAWNIVASIGLEKVEMWLRVLSLVVGILLGGIHGFVALYGFLHRRHQRRNARKEHRN